ncbi:unnamed protein product [Paramecium octaurelia]|uniref:Ion transport domain-containing protein n=1 Tax=Paramecium octaurelia TaxID=43137 RepID=A0A8S1XGV4_PAROT|nr:unnamed protein product [Paramecium octaurelia]
MLNSRRSQIPEFNQTFKSQDCSLQTNKMIIQEMYQCGQCFDYPHGICKYCFEHCHKKTRNVYHQQAKLLKLRGNFKCECGLFKHKQKQLDIQPCPLNSQTFCPISNCTTCKTNLCSFCIKNCKHTHQYLPGEGCKCNQLHSKYQLRVHYIEQLKKYNITKTLKYRPQDELAMIKIINALLNNFDLFELLFAELKNTFENIFNELETGDFNQTCIWSQKLIDVQQDEQNLNEKILELFTEKRFPYTEIASIHVFIEQLLMKLKYNLIYLDDKIWQCMTSSQIKFLVSQYHILSQNLQESAKEKLSQLVLKILKIQSIQLKYQFSKFRKIDTLDIENSTPIQRSQIRKYNQCLDNGILQVELTELIKRYYRILFDIEITNPILSKLLIVLLKCVKMGLQTGLLIKTQVVFKVILNLEKLCKDIDYYNQQKNFGQIQRFFTEQMFNLLSKILILTYFQMKDDLFYEILNEQINRNEKRQISLIDKYTASFYFEKKKKNLQIDLFYNGESEKLQIIWRVFINIVINYNLNGQYYNQMMNPQTKLNHVIQIMLRENLFVDTTLRTQIMQLQIEDLLLWKYERLTILNQDFLSQVDNFKSEWNKYFLNSIEVSFEIEEEDLERLLKLCKELLNTKYFRELEKFEANQEKICENQKKKNQSAKNLQEELKQHLKSDMKIIKQTQQILYEKGIDLIIIRYCQFLIQNQFVKLAQLEIMINITTLMFEILNRMINFNQQLINQIYTVENYQIFQRIAEKELPYYGQCALRNIIIKFHFDVILKSGFINVYQYCFLNPQFLLQHLIHLNEMLDGQYDDCAELTQKHASSILYNKHQIFELLIAILELIIISNETNHDYLQFHQLCENLYNKILPQVLNHSTDIFTKGNQYTPDSSSYDVFINQNQNRYSFMSFTTCLEQIQNGVSNNQGSPQNQLSQMSFFSINSLNQSHIIQQSFTMKQLNEIFQMQKDLGSQEGLAITTVLLTHTFIRFMNLIIDYFNRNQLLETQDLLEQASIIEKIEQIHQYFSQQLKQQKLFQGPLGGFEELVQVMEKFKTLVNYSLSNKHDNSSPPEIFQIKENNLSVAISQKAIDDIVRFKDKSVFQALNKVLLKLKLKRIELDNDILEQNAIVQLIKKEYRNRSKEQYSLIFINVLIELLQQQTQFQRNRNLEYPNTIFMSHINYIVQLQRLLQAETKPVQQIINTNIEKQDPKYPNFQKNFDSFLQYLSTKIIPFLFKKVIVYQDQPYLSIVINSGKYSIIVLEFIRYLAEGQNQEMQNYVGESGLLLCILKLLVDLFKSKQILEIVRETNNQNKIKSQTKASFQKAVHNVRTMQLKKKNSSTTDYLLKFLQKRKNSQKQTSTQNEFMQFGIHSTQGDQYGIDVSQAFLKLFAHTIITIAEFNQGSQQNNQKLTFNELSKNRVWQVIIQILTVRTNENQQNSVYTLRLYIFQLILSLLEDPERNPDDFQYIMNLINHKLLEETLTQTYRALIIFNKLDLKDLATIDSQLTEKYRRELGDNINESLIFDSKMLIKILYQIYKMLNLYATSSLEICQYLKDQKQQCQQGQPQLFKREGDHLAKSAFQFIFNIVGSIEYVNQKDQIEIFHFLKPPMCFFLSEETKLQFLIETIDRSNPASKLASIFDSIPQFMTEMKENMSKYRKSLFFQRLISVAISPNFNHTQLATSITALNIIVILLISNTAFVKIENEENRISMKYQESHSVALTLCQILLIFMSLLALICQLFFRMSIYYQISCKEVKHTFYNTFVIMFQILQRRDIFQFFLHFVLSILGTFEPFCFYLQSFCFIYISQTMSSVLEALRLRWQQFLGIFSVLLIILNAYSYIGFRRFATSFQLDVIVHPEDDIHEEELLCDTPAHCFISLVYFGLREGSGLAAHGDIESYHKSSDYYPRFLFDFSFFIIVTLIMINIINGIIIDTFAELRDKQQQNEYDRNNVCVICSLERWEFEKQGLQFHEHVDEVHSLSNYIAFIVHLLQVGKQNMNGIETHIYTKIINRDMSWTPLKQTQQLLDKL